MTFAMRAQTTRAQGKSVMMAARPGAQMRVQQRAPPCAALQATPLVTAPRARFGARRVSCAASVKKRSVGDLTKSELEGKRVLIRADLNVPMKDGKITDDTRIRAAGQTLKYLVDSGAKVLLTSHLGRPKEGEFDKSRLGPIAPRLSEVIGTEVNAIQDCVGDTVKDTIEKAPNGSVTLLENVRFYKEETDNDPGFAEKLAANADLFVHDAFGTAHRAHASTEGVTKYLKPNVAGFLLQKELDFLDGAVADPKRPFCAIVGGSKVSSKITVIESLLSRADTVILGGGMIFTFFKARGIDVGASLVEEDQLDLAKKLEQMAKDKGVQLMLPTDVVAASKFAEDAETKVVPFDQIPEGWMGLDIGDDSAKMICDELEKCKTVVWNGPMGVFEFEAFAKGTFTVAKKLAELTPKGCITIIGGGDSVAAVEKAGLADQMSHISTGGGASLELLEGKTLPGVAALDDA